MNLQKIAGRMFPQKVPVREMNPHLICALCGGYFIDATTIIECLHSFCKSCIVKHLETSKYCPICDVQVHKTQPLENIRPDHILQEIVYKLVPGLYQNEMRCRREFYRKHQENVPINFEAKGEISEECSIFFPEESIMLSLEYNSETKSNQSSYAKRYLQCPAAVTILHLQKLIRSKFGLTANCRVDFFYKDELLPEFLTLLDIAYSFQWRRKTPLHLSYQIWEIKSQIVKINIEKTEESSNSMETEKDTEVSKEGKEKWEEVELRISENGTMSAATASSSCSTSKENIIENSGKSTNLEAEVKEPKMEVLKSDEKGLENPEKLEKDIKKNDNKSISMSELRKELVKVLPAAKESSEVPVAKNTSVSSALNLKNAKKSESVEIAAVKTDNSIIKGIVKDINKDINKDITKDITKTHAQNEVSKTSDRKGKPKKLVKEELDESRVKNNFETNIKLDSVWELPPSPDNAKKVCKVEPNLLGLPSGLSIIQRPSVKTYPGLKPINSGKDDGIKAIAGLSKEVSIKPIISVSTSAASLPIKTDVSCSLKIPSSTTPIVPPSITKKATPIRYKTLKSPTKPWNPSIPRSSMLMMKQNNADNDPNQPKANVKPPKFFKMRNVPRYLGNPASGVKPMYQASEASCGNSETAQNNKLDLNCQRGGNSSVTLMKIDPKTLSPIAVSSACSSPSLSPSCTVSSHLKKSPLPPPYTPGSPKSKAVMKNKTPAHSTNTNSPIPSPAHSSSLLSSSPFFSAANPLMYPGFPHTYSPQESANRILAGAANPSDLIRAMSSLCSPTAAFHPSLPPSLSMLFNTHQVGFPRLNQSTNPSKLPPKIPSSKQMSPPVSSPVSLSISSPSLKPKKPITDPVNRVRPNLTIETSRFNLLYANGFLPSPTERLKPVSKIESDKKFSSKVDSLSKIKCNDQVQKMDVDSPKKEGKNIMDCDRDMPVSSNKRIKKDDVESNNNFKEHMNVVSTVALKDISCDIKPKPSLEMSEDKSQVICKENRNEINDTSKKDEIKSEGSSNSNIIDKSCTSTNSVEIKDESVMQSNHSDKKGQIDDENSSKSSADKLSKSDISLNVINNNCKTSSND